MSKRAWPAGIRPAKRGSGITIRIWHQCQPVFHETVPGDAYIPSDLVAAVKRRDELMARLRLGLPLFQGQETEHRIFGDVAQQYLERLQAKYSTLSSYTTILNTYWLSTIGRWPVNEVTTNKIESILASLKNQRNQKPLSIKTKKNLLIPLRGVLDHARVIPNPVLGIKFRRVQREPIERYRPEEQGKLLEALEGQPQAYFALLFGTGLRPGEALALTWADYDGTHLHIHSQIVRRRSVNSTKTSVRRRVFVPEWVRPYLRNLPSRFAGEAIFITQQGRHHLDAEIFNKAWKLAHKKAKVPYRIPYTCRHTRAAQLLSAGIVPGDAAKQLGHSLEMFLRTYSEWIEEYSTNRDLERFNTASPPRQNRVTLAEDRT